MEGMRRTESSAIRKFKPGKRQRRSGERKRAEKCRRLDHYHGQKITPMSAIRLRCIDCCGGQVAEVRKCTAFSCPLWGYRLGRAWEQPPCWSK